MNRSAEVLLVLAILLGCVLFPAFNFRVKKKPEDFVRNLPTSNYSKTLQFAKQATVTDRIDIFKAACDSSAFTCREIIQLASFDVVDWGPNRWANTVMLFAQGRANNGCILDPANAKSIVDAFENKWGMDYVYPQNHPLYVHPQNQARLTQAFITDNGFLKPAQGVGSPPMLQTGLRTGKDMGKLLTDLEDMMPENMSYRSGGALEEVFQDWLKDIRAQGEQFSAPQLVALVRAIPSGFGYARALSVLLNHLEQYLAGVTCKEVNLIRTLSTRFNVIFMLNQEYRDAGLATLKSNIVDGHNKVAIVADHVLNRIGVNIAQLTEELLRDVGVGLPPKNNPIFGVVKGNPVILVVDESDSMDANITIGDDTIRRRTFCHDQLEMVLEALPNGAYFNVIQYSSSAVTIFQNPVPVSKISIAAAMNKVSSTWRDEYTTGRDPVVWLRKVRGFSLKFKHQFDGSNTKSMEALQLAYAMTDLQSQQRGARARSRARKRAKLDDPNLHTPHDHGALVVTKDSSPQIYFLISGRPDGGGGQILDKIDRLDNGRNSPVNTITFSNASADPLTKQFGKDLASKTGGFFRSIEQA